MEARSEESRRMVSEFFVKSLNVILGARIPSRYLERPVTSYASGGNNNTNKGFNLILVNAPMRNKCHLSVVEPIVVDVLLLHHGPSGCAETRDEIRHSQESQQHQSLLERWVVHCVPWSCLKEPTSERNPEKKKIAAKKPPLSRNSVACSLVEEKKNRWKKVVKMLSIMLRSLYNLTRLLPAYRIFQQLNSSSSSDSHSCCHFDLSYKVRTTLTVSGGNANAEKSLCNFSLAPVETDLGRMCISVKYSNAESVEKAMQRTSTIFSEIIPDYVGGGSGSSPANPHFAVLDKRICAPTRTMSNNIPSARVTAAVQRSYSSPLQGKTSMELDHPQEQLVCPFACDDERKLSREAAAGELITTLLAATPIQRSSPHKNFVRITGTIANSLREFQSYKSMLGRNF